MSGPPPPPSASRREHTLCFLATLGLLLAGAAAQVGYLFTPAALDLSGDEAHYWDWSRQLDLSYYAKGPLVAYVIAMGRWSLAGWSQQLLGNEVLALRLPAILLSTLTGLGIHTLSVQTLRRPRLALAAVAVLCTVPMLAVGGMLMTIDAPLACLWVWALVSVHCALQKNRRHAWFATGVLIALGILAKYNMVLIFPVVGLAILLTPEWRHYVRRPAPWLTVGLGLLGCLPILVWNAQHDWVGFRHVAGQAGVADAPRFNPAWTFEYMLGQAAVLGPPWFVAMIAALVSAFRRPVEPGEPHDAGSMRLLAIATLSAWLVFLAFSPIAKIQPNWPMLSALTAVILVPFWIARRLKVAPRRRATWLFVACAAASGAAMTALAYRTDVLMPLFAWLARDAPPWDLTPTAKYDPAARLRGWRELGAAVGEVAAEQRAAGRDPFILADDYMTVSQLAFYTPGQPRTYSAELPLRGKFTQYALWENPLHNPEKFVGRPVVFVGSLRPELTGEGGRRAALLGLRAARTVEVRVGGELQQVWTVFVADRFEGFDAAPRRERKY